MKNLLCFCFLIFFTFSNSLSAQFELRILGGINSSTFTTDYMDADFRSGLGYQFGADVLIGDSWYFQPGLLFEFLQNPVYDIDINTRLEDIQVSRLRVPIYIGHRFREQGSFLNLRLFAGVNASLVVDRSIDESLDIEEDDLSDLIYGLNIGGGFDVAFLFIDAGYMFGLNDVFKNAMDSPHNNLFYVNAGINF